MSVRRIAPGEEKAAALIEKTSLPTAWSERQIAEAEACGNVYLVFEDEGGIAGMISAVCAGGECEVMNLAVKPERRRNGAASALLSGVEETAKQAGAERITLEVAEGNAAAIALYEKNGFCRAGRRKNFYRGEDALIMEKTL